MSSGSYMKKWRVANPEKWLVSSCKQTARNKRLPFDITHEDISIPTHCPILGIELRMGTEGL